MANIRNFFKCGHCGNIITMIHSAGPAVACCGLVMPEIVPNTVDAALEKHVPVPVRDGNKLTVNVGSIPHPMMPEHHIAWIIAAQERKTQRVVLAPTGAPTADFILDDGPVTIYEYCNLHGLWQAEGKTC